MNKKEMNAVEYESYAMYYEDLQQECIDAIIERDRFELKEKVKYNYIKAYGIEAYNRYMLDNDDDADTLL